MTYRYTTVEDKQADLTEVIPLALVPLCLFLNMSLSSPKLKRLFVENRKSQTHEQIRANLNIFVRADFDNFKSTILTKAQQEYGIKRIWHRITLPGLVGSVYENETVEPAAWTCNGSALMADEYVSVHGDLPGAYNSLLESPHIYVRQIHSGKVRFNKRKGDGTYFTVKDGMVSIKSIFACIQASMYSRQTLFNHLSSKSMMSRFIYCEYHLTPDDRVSVIDGAPVFVKQEFFPQEEVVIQYDDYKKIRDIWYNGSPQKIARVFGDMLRAFAITGEHNKMVYSYILNQEA